MDDRKVADSAIDPNLWSFKRYKAKKVIFVSFLDALNAQSAQCSLYQKRGHWFIELFTRIFSTENLLFA